MTPKFSETYLLMVKKSSIIQRMNLKSKPGQYIENGLDILLTCNHYEPWEIFYWIPRLDELLAMFETPGHFKRALAKCPDKVNLGGDWNELALSLVMADLHQMEWTGKKWEIINEH